jgi:sugar O-acyltransferase (sialic acid O-acetyltransferase NeuD family)
MEKIVIFGAGLYAELFHFMFSHDSPYRVAGFTVDRDYLPAEGLLGLPVVPFDEVEGHFPPSEYKMFVGISFQKVNMVREEKYLQAKLKGYGFISFVSSKAITWPGLMIGENSFIGANCTVEPFVKIGNNVSVTTSVVVGHHAVLHDHCFVAPGATILGGCSVGSHCLIGANATIKENVTVARECVIGMGVSITKNTQERGVYITPSPKLFEKGSDELREWLSWHPQKPRWGTGTQRGGCGT